MYLKLGRYNAAVTSRQNQHKNFACTPLRSLLNTKTDLCYADMVGNNAQSNFEFNNTPASLIKHSFPAVWTVNTPNKRARLNCA